MSPVAGALPSDRARQIFTIAAAVAQAALPTVLVPRFTPDLRPPDVIQPAPYTFSVWVPIFGSSLVYAAAQARPTWARDPVMRQTGWPLAAAFAGIGAWAPLVARSRFWSSEGALVSTAVLAEHTRRQLARYDKAGLLTPSQRNVALPPASLLAAWSAAASMVQLTSMVAARGHRRPGWAEGPTALAAVIAAGVAATTATATTPGGRRTRAARIYAGTTAWGLTGIAIGQRRRKPATATLAILGAATVATATI